MRQYKSLLLLLATGILTACAPVVYESSYYEPRPAVNHHLVQRSYPYPTTYRSTNSLLVTLYANGSYTGVNFSPISFYISEGDYVEIPHSWKRGHTERIFAHYDRHSLHFDSDRNCRNIRNSSRFSYDQRWVNGHEYSQLRVGASLNFPGLNLRIRETTNNRRRPVYDNQKRSYRQEKVERTDPVHNRRPDLFIQTRPSNHSYQQNHYRQQPSSTNLDSRSHVKPVAEQIHRQPNHREAKPSANRPVISDSRRPFNQNHADRKQTANNIRADRPVSAKGNGRVESEQLHVRPETKNKVEHLAKVKQTVNEKQEIKKAIKEEEKIAQQHQQSEKQSAVTNNQVVTDKQQKMFNKTRRHREADTQELWVVQQTEVYDGK